MHIEGSRGADIQILRNVNIHGCGHTGGEEECGREKDRERTYGGRHANIQVGRAEGMGRETTSGVWTCRGASTRGVGYCPSCVPVNACDSVFETRHSDWYVWHACFCRVQTTAGGPAAWCQCAIALTQCLTTPDLLEFFRKQ